MKGPPPHGTISRYTNQACRCEKCRAANAETQRAYQRRLGRQPRAEYEASVTRHGISSAKRRKCRCEICRAAIRDEKRRYRAQHALACKLCGGKVNPDNAKPGSTPTGLCLSCYRATRKERS